MTDKVPTPAEKLQAAKKAASETRAERRKQMDDEYNAAVAAAYLAFSQETAPSN